MLFRLEVENFGSIRERQVIDLVAAENVPDDFEHLAPVWIGAKERAPKVVGIFGPNAAGKTTILRSIAFLSWFVQHSAQIGETQDLRFWYEPFSSEEALVAPTRLAVHFAGPPDLKVPAEQMVDTCRYAYELEFVCLPNEKPKVVSEVLRFWPKEKGKGTTLLSRRGREVKGSKGFPLGAQGASIEAVMHANASVISTLAFLKHPIATHMCQTAATVVCNLLVEKYFTTDQALVNHYAQWPNLVESINRDVQRIDLGLKGMRITNSPNGPLAHFEHSGLLLPVPFNRESQGTKSYLHLFPYISGALATGGVVVLDELDSALHPLLLRETVSRFYNPELNPHNAQLWFTCQDATLLEALIKEEIYFCEKSSAGKTSVFGLKDIKGVRRIDNYYRKYLSGEFGAVPRFG